MARATRYGPIRRCGRSISVPDAGSAHEVDAVHTYYGESHVLQGVSLSVAPSEVLAILGRNGMGKTTLIRTIIGFTPPRRGSIRFKGQDITLWPPFRMVESGMALVPQGRRVFPSLSDGKTRRPCGTSAMPLSTMRKGGQSVMSCPLKRMEPRRGGVKPMMVRMSVVFPIPFRPRMA